MGKFEFMRMVEVHPKVEDPSKENKRRITCLFGIELSRSLLRQTCLPPPEEKDGPYRVQK